jgi:hypothetical protein
LASLHFFFLPIELSDFLVLKFPSGTISNRTLLAATLLPWFIHWPVNGRSRTGLAVLQLLTQPSSSARPEVLLRGLCLNFFHEHQPLGFYFSKLAWLPMVAFFIDFY